MAELTVGVAEGAVAEFQAAPPSRSSASWEFMNRRRRQTYRRAAALADDDRGRRAGWTRPDRGGAGPRRQVDRPAAVTGRDGLRVDREKLRDDFSVSDVTEPGSLFGSEGDEES